MSDRRRGIVLPVLAGTLLLTACNGSPREAGPAVPANAARLSLMTFNVENLFDSTHDPGKNDYTYLPIQQKQTDRHRRRCGQISRQQWREQCLHWNWDEDAQRAKLERIAGVIRQVNGGLGPDILVLQEVENLAVLERLRRDYLAESGYGPGILVEGDDARGIDVAFLSRLPLDGTPRRHRIPRDRAQDGDVRGILEATFVLPDRRLLTGFGVHFPAPYHPVAQRLDAYAFLGQLAARLPAERLVFAAGDFNTPGDEEREHAILTGLVRPRWIVVHEHCRGCPGTSYYAPRRQWSFLDMILLSPHFTATAAGGWRLDLASVRLANALPAQRSEQGTPAAFELPGRVGVSDHWPLVAEIVRVAD